MVKVLTNDFQSSLDMHYRWGERGFGRAGRGEEFEFFNTHYYKPHSVVFNRVGHYLDGTDCWWEFKLEDGSFRAIKADAEMFKYQLKIKNSEEKPFADEDWKAIERLLTRGTLKMTDQFRFEFDRRRSKEMAIDMGKRLVDFKKRVRAKVAAKKESE